MNRNGILVADKMFTFTLESTHFMLNKCPIYTLDGASAKLSTNSYETDYSVSIRSFWIRIQNSDPTFYINFGSGSYVAAAVAATT